MAGKQIALIRGINVGKAKRVAMGDLRKAMENDGFSDVKTLLNSGNVVFTPPKAMRSKIDRRIETLIGELGVSAKVLVLSSDELAEIVNQNPLKAAENEPSRFLVMILGSEVDRGRLKELAKTDWSPDQFALSDRAAYLWCAGGILESKLANAIMKAVGEHGTSRNWATMNKLLALAQS